MITSVETPDNDIQLVLRRYNPALPYADTYGCTYDEARAMMAKGRYNELLNRIVSKFKRLESRCEFVLCAGTDYAGVSSAFEFDFNADVASNLGCPVMIVINGGREVARRPGGCRACGPQGLRRAPLHGFGRRCQSD